MCDILTVVHSKFDEESEADDWHPGDPLIARFSDDESWYRATVVDVIHSTGHLDVLFVDYGERKLLKPRDCHKKHIMFDKIPIQVQRCQLENIVQEKNAEPLTVNLQIPVKNDMFLFFKRIY